MDYKNLSLIELSELLQNKEATSKEIYAYFIERAKKYNEELNAFTTLPEQSPSYLLGKDGIKLSSYPTIWPSDYLPIAVKDTFCEKWIRTTSGSKMLEDFVPPYESTVTSRMKQAGFISFGKTNMDEFALGGSGENSAFGPTRNPRDPTRIPWGTSSGSAAAVAAWLVPAALGTDTGGSIRQPASMCGIVGWKPTYGRNSRYGVIAAASSLDTPGYLTKTVRDAAWLYEMTAWYDPLDATSLSESVSIDPKIWEKKDLTWVKIGIPKEYFIDGIERWVRDEIEASIEVARSLWAEIIDISLPHTSYGISAYYIINPAEVASNLARYDGIRYGHKSEWGFDIAKNREEWLGSEAKRRSLVGSFVLSSGFYDAYYKKSTAVRELIRTDFRSAFEQVDVILTPTAPTVAWKIGQKWDDPLALYLEDVFTVPASLAGIPGLTIPVGYASPLDDPSIDLPVGLQILWPLLWEENCLMVGHVLEGAMRAKVGAKKPKIF
jgi:aspartyl-tRNA(Asn)/glutamyl-tRNA(Gln) amidotransferase subunit A